ncbi:MAG: hypothetical protein FD156_199 [Nitrospirae bacterium]|nr:MAG: hypothetical protein FD156_199 [Nitrospirota bacterium]
MGKKKKSPSNKKVEVRPSIDDCPDKNCIACDDSPLLYFVKHPPKGTLSPKELEKMSLFIGEHEIKSVTNEDGVKLPVSFHIISRAEKFKETGNPVYAIESFINAHEAGLYPPLSILNFLADTFKKYHEIAGKGKKTSLDKLLGFSNGKGQDKAFKQVMMADERNQTLMVDIYILRRLFGLSVEKAAAMVGMRLEEIPDEKWNKTEFKINKIVDRSLKDEYNKNWKKNLEQDAHVERTTEFFSKWTEEDKIEYLKKYPPISIPEKLRQKYKIKA